MIQKDLMLTTCDRIKTEFAMEGLAILAKFSSMPSLLFLTMFRTAFIKKNGAVFRCKGYRFEAIPKYNLGWYRGAM